MAAWFNNFSAKLTAWATILELPTADISVIVADNVQVQKYALYKAQQDQEGKEYTAFKNIELYGPIGVPTPTVPAAPPVITLLARPAGIIPRAEAMANRCKAHPAYTEAIGMDLGIIAPEVAMDVGLEKPTGKAISTGGFTARLEWKKGGHDGVVIETQRAGETGWTVLAFDSHSPYIDNRPPLVAGAPEERRYRMKYKDGEEMVGIYSDVIAVIVGA